MNMNSDAAHDEWLKKYLPSYWYKYQLESIETAGKAIAEKVLESTKVTKSKD